MLSINTPLPSSLFSDSRNQLESIASVLSTPSVYLSLNFSFALFFGNKSHTTFQADTGTHYVAQAGLKLVTIFLLLAL